MLKFIAMNGPMLCAEHFSARIDGQVLLRDITFELKQGEWMGVTGRSGAGKSLLGKCLSGLAPGGLTADGDLFFDRKNMGPHLQKNDARRFALSYMPQDPAASFNPVQRVGTQVEEVFRQVVGSSPQIARRKSRDILDRMDFEDADRIARAYPHELSGGQAQRALLAMMAAKQPKVFILDEPTTDLDLITESGVIDLIGRIADDLEAGLLFITHDIGLLNDLCSRLLFLERGQLVEEWISSQGKGKEAVQHLKSDAGRALLRSSNLLNELIEQREEVSHGKKSLLRTEQLSKTYGSKGLFLRGHSPEVRAVTNFDFDFQEGKMYGVLGASGSGKSTLAGLLAGITVPSEGKLYWKGQRLEASNYRKRIHGRGGVQLIYQNPFRSFDPTKTMDFSLGEASKSSNLEQSALFIQFRKKCEVEEEWLNRYPRSLSGGQLQRLAVLRSLLMEPSLLLADESTSALDNVNQIELFELFSSIKKSSELGIIIFSHQIRLLLAYCDELLVLQDGELVEYGPPSSLRERSDQPFFRAYRNLILD